jgi:hypothetical protein
VINEFYGLKKSEAIIKLIEHNKYIQIGAGGQYISPDGDVIHGGDLVSREYFEDVLRTQALYIPPSSAAPRIDPSQWNAVLEKYRPILAQKKIPVLHWRDMVKEFKHQGTPPLDALYYAEHLRVHLMAEEQLLGYMLDGEMIKDYIAVVTVPFLIGQEGPDGRKIENADYILKEYLQHP